MAKRIPILLAAMTALTFAPQTAEACTGITLTAKARIDAHDQHHIHLIDIVL